MNKILIVDDERSIRQTFEIFLKKEGYDVFLAEDVPHALDIVDKNDIDLIFTDIIMPKITGIDMMSMLKDQNPDIPIIIMTGEPTVETAQNSVKDNAYDYLIKPVSKEVLLKSAKLALMQKRLMDDKIKLELENNEYRNKLEFLVEKRTLSLQEALNGTISTIAKILESMDPYTAGHEYKVANLSLKIAEKMGLTQDQKECTYFAGYLHDIGKLFIPAEILSKPGKITSSEYTLIKDHVLRGYELIKEIQLPWNIADVILQHHERIDGSGYPMGLKGSEIMVESKILAIADVVEAMASHRPYRPGYSVDQALSELKQNIGILYDDQVSKVTIELFEEDNYTLTDDSNILKIEL